MGWTLWWLNAIFWAILISGVGRMISGYRQASRNNRQRVLTPKQEELNRQALLKRKANANKELHTSWTYQFSDLQIQAHKRKLEAQQEQEKEKE